MADRNKQFDSGEIQPTLLRNALYESKNKINTPRVLSVSLLLVSLLIALSHFYYHKKIVPPTQNKQPTQSQTQSLFQRISSKISSPTVVKAPEGVNNANHFYDQAVALMKNGMGPKAIPLLQQALTLQPTFEKAREALAVLFIQTEDISSAIDTLNAGIELAPNYYPFIKLKAQIFFSEGLTDQALGILTESMPSISQYPNYYQLLARIYTKQRQYLVAADIYHQLADINPNNGNWWFGMAASLNLAGKDSQAMSAYQRALQTSDLKPDVRAYIESVVNS